MQPSSTVRTRRDAVASAWDLRRGAVIVPAGVPVSIAGTDQFHDFWAHPEFRYLAGTSVAQGVMAFDPGEGWTLFAPVASFEDRVWVGDGVPLETLAAQSAMEQVRPLAELGGWLERRRGEPLALLGNQDLPHRPEAYGLQNWTSLEISPDEELSSRLAAAVTEMRRAKDVVEIERMQSAASAAVEGHLLALKTVKPGMTERTIQVELEAEFFRRGGDRTAYGSIVGGGPNSAVLHSSPSGRVIEGGELLLIDAAPECAGYAADVTRTMPAGPRFEGIQRDLYQLVLDVQQSAIARVRPGVEFKDLHLAACRQIAGGLVGLGLLRGSPDTLVERDSHALFFPHGLGHMLGLSTHDAGGCLAGRTASDRFGLKWLRADLPLDVDYVVTIEPGIYLIPALVNDPDRRERFKDAVNWDLVDSLMPFGGIRIEDDVRVTGNGAQVLSHGLPKSIAHIEALRGEAFSS
jgi:Xaa-Pro aminopeptidase